MKKPEHSSGRCPGLPRCKEKEQWDEAGPLEMGTGERGENRNTDHRL